MSIADLFVSGQIKIGEDFLSKPGTTWYDTTPSGVTASQSIAYDGTTIVAHMQDATGRHTRASTDNGASWGSAVRTCTQDTYDADSPSHGVFLLGTDSGDVYRSTDSGATWSTVTSTASGAIRSLTHGNGYCIGGSYDGEIIYSTDDGATWTEVASPLGAARRFMGVAHGNGRFVGVGNSQNTIGWCADTDPTSWTSATSPFSGDGGVAIDFDPVTQLFVAIAYDADDHLVSSTSSDGATWSAKVQITGSGNYSDVLSAEGVFIVPVSTGVFRSADGGETWENTNAVTDRYALDGCVGDNGRLFICCSSSPTYSSFISYSDWFKAGAGIIEQGSNSNGEYVIFSSGLQICWDDFSENIAVNSSSSWGGYYKNGTALTFPKAFGSAPSVICAVREGPVSVGSHSESTTGFTPRWRAVSSNTGDCYGSYIAIGTAA